MGTTLAQASSDGGATIGVLIFMVVVATTIWVLVDAPQHGLSRWWAAGLLFLWIAFFPIYLWERSKAKKSVAHLPSARWYPDPWEQAPYRWWDGTAWTSHTTQVPEP